MSHSEGKQTWRARLGWLASELVVVFIGVSAAFLIDNYRDSRAQAAEFHQALSGLIAELNRTETRGHEFADNITSKVDEWEKADRNHQRAIPGYYRIPGSTHPPTAAWNTMVRGAKTMYPTKGRHSAKEPLGRSRSSAGTRSPMMSRLRFSSSEFVTRTCTLPAGTNGVPLNTLSLGPGPRDRGTVVKVGRSKKKFKIGDRWQLLLPGV
jgi:hypothetical protein